MEKVKFPGIPATVDGAGAVAHVESNICDMACGYPITPSTTMGQEFQLQVAGGKKNLWGQPLAFFEPESEHSSASACEGVALAGGRVTNFTSGQGLILMKEVLYVMSGKRLPIVFHIAARALTSQSLNIHAGHDDVMGVADCGWGMLFCKSAQDATDMAVIARKTAEESQTPFMVIQDGFLTTHTVENVYLPEPELMKEFVGDPRGKLRNLIDPENPIQTGVVQNQDSYMKGKIAQRFFYDKVPQILAENMKKYSELTGRKYDMVTTYNMSDASYAIVAMGSFAETAFETVDYIRRTKGIKIGVVHVTSFRPFPGREIVEALKSTDAFTVLERMDNPLAQSNPLTAEIKSAFADALSGHPDYQKIARVPTIYSGCGGLGSRDVRPSDFIAIAENMLTKSGKRFFVVGIKHPLALERGPEPDTRGKGAFAMRGHSVGGYGSVTTNKVIASLVGDIFGLSVQAYPKYGSEKKGLPTTFYLSIAQNHIKTHCELEHVDFVSVNDINAFRSQNPLAGLAERGILFMHTDKTSAAEIWAELPSNVKKEIRDKNLSVYALDTVKIARECSSSPALIQRMQGIVLLGVFLKVAPFKDEYKMSDKELFGGAERALGKFFGKKGEKVIQDNINAIKRGYSEIIKIPRDVILSSQEKKLVGGVV